MNFENYQNVRIVRSSWLEEGGRRLDCNPYMSGALEARDALRNLKVNKEPLRSLTAGYAGGIYNGPMFARHWVSDPQYGVPFLGSGDMLNDDLSSLPLLKRVYAQSPYLRHLEVRPGTTLITCSGTIGRMTYVRPDMAGMWSSQHIMKVVADETKIPPGYLYAYLSSKYGVPLVVSGTYGAIIQHIEPEHISELPVPRFAFKFERRIDSLINKASDLRSNSVGLLREAQERLYSKLCLQSPTRVDQLPRPDISSVSSESVLDRCDAYYYSARNTEARVAFDSAGKNKELGDVAEVFIPGIFKRLYASDPEFGSPYITGGDVFEIAPTSDKYLMRRVAEAYGLLLKKGMIVVQEAGQLGGLIGRSVMVGEYLDGFACSNNMIRIVPEDDIDGGYLFALLSSEYGIRLLSREAAGSSIPHTDQGRVRKVRVPWPDRKVRTYIGDLAIQARELRDKACQLDAEARTAVEAHIENGQ